VKRAALLTLLLAIACGTATSPASIEQLDVKLTVLTDGSMQVQQLIVVDLGVTPVGEYRWRAPMWRHDGVTGISASMDGAAYPAGEGTGRVSVRDGRNLDVRWQFPPTSKAHVFGLSYRASNVVELSGIRGTVLWRAIPAGIGHDVSKVRISMTVPESAVLLDDPWVEEAGWTVTREAHGMTAVRPHVPRGEAATVGLEFAVDHMSAPISQWQTNDDRAEQFIAAWISAAVSIVAVAAGVIWMMRMKLPAWPRATDGTPRDIGTAQVLWRARRRSGRAFVDALIADGLVDRERAHAARDLWRAGIATIVLGLLAWAVTNWTLWQYGAWPLVVPFSIVVAGVIFLIGAARFPVLSEAGARGRVLYCARISDGKTTA